jgi:hypothetical protein
MPHSSKSPRTPNIKARHLGGLSVLEPSTNDGVILTLSAVEWVALLRGGVEGPATLYTLALLLEPFNPHALDTALRLLPLPSFADFVLKHCVHRVQSFCLCPIAALFSIPSLTIPKSKLSNR